MNRLTCSILFAFAGALPACGSLDSHTGSTPTLATIQGSLANPEPVPIAGAVRVAVVWEGALGGFNVAEDLPVQPVFPSSFTIDLDVPPPSSAMHGEDAGTAPSPFGVAVGTVVAYVDKNGNGKLDLVPTGAGGYVDQILATSGNLTLNYVEGTLPAIAGALPFGDGYSLLSSCDTPPASASSPGSICPTPPDAGAPCSPEVLPITTPIVLTASSDPQVSALMCESAGTTTGSTGTSGGSGPNPPPATYPSPCDPNLACSADGSSYTYATCQTVQTGLCEGTSTNCTALGYDRPSPVPPGWPCKS
jgi:hypothetical protein